MEESFSFYFEVLIIFLLKLILLLVLPDRRFFKGLLLFFTLLPVYSKLLSPENLDISFYLLIDPVKIETKLLV